MISSRTNPKIVHAVRVREGQEPDLVFVEGARLCAELISAGWPVESIFYVPESAAPPSGLALEPTAVTDSVMQKLAGTVSSQGIVIIARKPNRIPPLPSQGLLLALDAVQDPGNVGTLLRTAEAAGVQAVILLDGCASAWSPKALRASMGSAFRVPVHRMNAEQLVSWCDEHHWQLVAAAGGGSVRHTKLDFTQPMVLVLGNEGNGVSPPLLAASNQRVSIPLHGQVESLNVAAAAAVLLFEAARQRHPD